MQFIQIDSQSFIQLKKQLDRIEKELKFLRDPTRVLASEWLSVDDVAQILRVSRRAERLTLEPNQRNSLNFSTPRGLQFTLGLQFGHRVLRGIFAKMHRNSLGFTAISEFLKSAGFEPNPTLNTGLWQLNQRQSTTCLMASDKLM